MSGNEPQPVIFDDIFGKEIKEKKILLRQAMELSKKTNITIHILFPGNENTRIDQHGDVLSPYYTYNVNDPPGSRTRQSAIEMISALEIFLEEQEARFHPKKDVRG